MFHFHQVNGFCYPLWLVPINRVGTTGCHGAKSAATGAGISQNHKSGRTSTPAFAHVGTIAAFANSMKFMRIYQVANMLITFANGQFYTKPIWFFGSLFLGCIYSSAGTRSCFYHSVK